jgi:hypothetical protein
VTGGRIRSGAGRLGAAVRAMGVLAGAAVVVLVGVAEAPPAGADERVDAIADELGRSGVYITDHAPREISAAEDGPEVRRALARVPGKVFLAVTPSVGVSGEPLIALLHDRLGADGVYVVMGPNGIDFDAVQYGPGGLPVKEAAYATLGLASDAGPLARLRRFAEAVSAGRERAAVLARRASSSDAENLSDRRDRIANMIQIASTAVGATAAVVLVHLRRRRRRPITRIAPAAGPSS